MKTIIIVLFQMFLFIGVYPQTGKVVIRIENEKNVPTLEYESKSERPKLKSSSLLLNQTLSKYNAIGLRKMYPSSKRAELLKYYIIETDNHKELMNELKTKHPYIFSEVYEFTEPQALYLPNDIGFSTMFCQDSCRQISLRYLELINLPSAWEITQGDPAIIVGIHDNHLYEQHFDLAGKIYKIYDENDRSMYFCNPDHGTMVAGIIAAKTDNNKGISSVAFNCRLAKSSKNYDDLLKMARDGIKVINISQEWEYHRPDQQELINELTEDYGVTVVAAAGNKNETEYVYPASYDNVISVTSVGYEFERGTIVNGLKTNWKDCHMKYIRPNGECTSHQHNDKVDICAPGYNLITLCHPETYKDGLNRPTNQLFSVVEGTSFASAIVSGVCALMYSVNPKLKPADVEKILKMTAVKIDTIPENMPYKGMLGAGRIDAFKAVKMAKYWPDSSFGNSVITTSGENQKSDIKVYPNPARDAVNVQTDGKSVYTVELFSLNGSLLYKSKTEGTLHRINLSNLSNGVYFVTVKADNFFYTRKIMKL